MHRKEKGSTTLFLCLLVSLILSLIFSMSEVTRFIGLESTAKGVTDVVAESTFAEYNRILWNDYGILGLDASYGAGQFLPGYMEQRMSTRIEDNCNAGIDKDVSFLRMTAAGCAVASYGILTDCGGAPFIKEAAKAAMVQIPENVLNERLKNKSAIVLETNYDTVGAGAGSGQEAGLNVFQGMSIINSVIPQGTSLSEETFSVAGSLSNRMLNEGTNENKVSASAMEKLLFQEYVLENFGCYTHDGKGRMQYELEYILCGKESDQANLEATIKRLIAFRESQNLISLYKDAGRMAEATSLAIALAGASANPAVIEAVKVSIVAAWAYAESVLDARMLLNGGKISLSKNSAEWTSELFAIPSYGNTAIMARNCPNGMSYEDYLRTFFLLESKEKMALRALDMLETTIRSYDDYSEFQMDFVVYDANFEYTFEASPIFASFITIPVEKKDSYYYTTKKYLSYLD